MIKNRNKDNPKTRNIEISLDLSLSHLKGSHYNLPKLMNAMLKTNDGYISSSLKIEQMMGGCHHLSNYFDNLSRSSNAMEYSRLSLDCPGP